MASADFNLVERARRGERAALEEILGRYKPLILSCADASISAEAKTVVSAEDVLQDVQLEAFLAIEKFQCETGGSLAAWLREITRNTVTDINRSFDALKRAGTLRRDGRSLEALPEAILYDLRFPDRHQSSPSRAVRHEEAMKLLNALIELLPAANCRLMKLQLAGADPETMAAELGISVGSVYTRLCRARRELKAALQAHISEFESFL